MYVCQETRAESSHKQQNTHPINLAAPNPDGKGVSDKYNQPLNHYNIYFGFVVPTRLCRKLAELLEVIFFLT